jgi:hypothetical protein
LPCAGLQTATLAKCSERAVGLEIYNSSWTDPDPFPRPAMPRAGFNSVACAHEPPLGHSAAVLYRRVALTRREVVD